MPNVYDDEKQRTGLDNSPYDDQKALGNPTDPRGDVAAGDPSDPRGPADRDSLRQAEDSAGGKRSSGSSSAESPSELRDAEQSSDDDSQGGLFNPNDSGGPFGFGRGKDKGRQDFSGKGWLRRNKKAATIIAFGTFCSAFTILVSLLLGSFGLVNFMKNVESAGFKRYQVDLSGRSSKWINAYMELRFSEVDDPNLAPKDRDNLLFRSSRVDTNSPLTDWYKTLRASKFEQDVFESKGIKFTSVAYKDGNQIKFRAGVMTLKNENEKLTFDPSLKAIDAIQNGDPNIFNGELQKFVDVKIYKNDKQARAAIKSVVRENNPQWWKAVKRWHLRKDIQNMIGVRNWRFFERTRDKVSEKKIDMRNRLITNALPENGVTSNFIKCLFGMSDCKASSDPANPNANDHATLGSATEDAADEEVIHKVEGAVDPAAGEAAGAATRKLAAQIVDKANLLSLVDMLSRFDDSIKNHKLSKLITQARSAYAAGAFTAVGVAADQLTTGDVNNNQVQSFMNEFSNPTNSEGWAKVVDNPSSSNASAASSNFTMAKNKQEFCSDKHQEAIDQPENRQAAEKEFQYLCPDKQVGGASNAQALESAWNSGPGAILHPILSAFHKVFGPVFDIVNSIIGSVTDPIIKGTLSALGINDDVNTAVASVTTKAVAFAGASPPIGQNTPSGQVANTVIQGGAVMGEASMRDQGAAQTTQVTRALATKNVLAYEQDQEHSSFANRYLALSNPKSLLSRQLFALSMFRFKNLGVDTIGVFGSSLSNAFRSIFYPAHAATPDGYAAANFAGIETWDFPPQCINNDPLSMTPQSSTNADDLGVIPADELNWDMLNNKESFWNAVYSRLGDDEGTAKKIWNCALLDNAARGGIGAQYGYKGEDAFDNGGGSDSGSDAGQLTDDVKQLAQQILDSNNVTYQFSAKDDVKKAAETGKGTNNEPIDPRALQIVVALAKDHKVDVSAYESYGQGHSAGSDHYSGHAVDIANIDGKAAYLNITDFWDEIKPYSSKAVFLQGDCAGAKSAPSGMNRLPGDACNHQHISFR